MQKPKHHISGEEVDENTMYDAMEEAQKTAAASSKMSKMSGGLLFCLCIIGWFFQRWLESNWLLVSLGIGLLVVIMGSLLFDRSRLQRHLHAALRRRGVNICSNCGYSMRGLNQEVTQCPECGEKCDALSPPQEPHP